MQTSPALRFAEYDLPWEGIRIGNVTNLSAGGTPSTLESSYWGGDIPWMNSGELNLKQVFNVEGRITEYGLNNSSTKWIPSKSVLIGLAGQGKTRGTAAVNHIPLCTNQSIAAIYPQDNVFDSMFLFFNIDGRYDELRRLSTGEGGRGGLNLGILKSLMVRLPSLPEQQKVAAFLSAVDTKIQQLQRKKELLEQYKKGVMQKIFSQEIRFKDKDGSDYPDWEEKRLGSYLVKHSEKTDQNNQYPVLTSSRIGLFFQKDYFAGNEVASKDNTGYNVVPRGYFTYRHMSDDLVFKFNINNLCDRGIVSTLYPVFTTTNQIDDKFLLLKLNDGDEFKRYALLQKQGGSRTYMYFNKIEKLAVRLPNIKEQIRIVSFFEVLASKIDSINYQS